LKSRRILGLILTVLIGLTGCSSSKPTSKSNIDTPSSPPATSENKSTSAIPTEQKYYAPFTGEEVPKEAVNKQAVMSIIENSPDAWPQSGFTEADIVFEAMVEGGITRCLALYQKESSPKIGPVRSMRTYFIDIAYEYNLPFAHCGASHDAYDRLRAEKPMNLDEMFNSSYFWRDKTIKIQEHSLYTSSEKLVKLASDKGYTAAPLSNLKFDKGYWEKLSTSKANNVNIRFNGAYSTNYAFKDGLYYKSMNNKPTLNKEDNKGVAVKNIVIQNVNYKTRPKEAYLDAELVGQGSGYIISNGKSVKVTWAKADLKSQTVFKDDQGNIVPLNQGKTWWHFLDSGSKVTLSE
jgi:hypothetical protein